MRVVVAGALAAHAAPAALFLPRLRTDAFGPALRAALVCEAAPDLPVEVAG
ncbi:hypothetical protein [Amycolatopsis sp. NPDC001319]|uniref:hypothetical protein n=1 Tax=unclassified Amycolatopsis TaxID=2618356 RepID=UPI0036C84CFD